jgi:tetratricopeptide (TPR) repeat protein
MRRATDQFDERAAAALARSLVDLLCKSPDDVRILETLVILGLAHPGALARHRISLANEGKRLAYLLEKAGQFERAYCLGELIAERAPVGEAPGSAVSEDSAAVEQLVRDAELAAARGRNNAAIRCLEEALKLDPSRTELQRAIRELRRKKETRADHAKRSLKLVTIVVIASAVATAIAVRELKIWNAWTAIPEAEHDDVQGMRTRLAGVERLLSEQHFWITMPVALLDRDLLKHDIELAARPKAPPKTDFPQPEPPSAESTALEQAEAARNEGLQEAEKGHVDDAIAKLKRSLALAPETWALAPRVRADIAALEAWQKKLR